MCVVLDISLLRNSDSFPDDPSARTGVAMVHHSFRTVSVRRGVDRQRFAAHFPALGLLNLAHALRVDAAAGLVGLPDIRYFDQESYADEGEMVDAVKAWLASRDRKVIAASSYTSTIDRLEDFLARFDPTTYLLMVGGAHASLAPDLDNAHLVVRGEGRAAFRHVLTTFPTADFGSGPDAAGICFEVDGRPVSVKQAFDRSLEQLPSPGFAYDLLPDRDERIYATNFTRMLGTRPQVYICTQSCRARCSFCSTYLIHGRTVARPAALVAADVDYLVNELGTDSLEFHDDDLMQHPELDALLEVMAGSGIPWFCYARVDQLDQRIAERLAEAGCRRVFLGVESMHQETLDYYNKATTTEQNRRAVSSLDQAGIGVIAGFIIGAPQDTYDTILDNLDAYLELPLLAINCSILSPDPGTAEFRRARKRGGELRMALGGATGSRLIPNPNRYGTEAPFGLPSVCVAVSKRELNILQIVIDASFYGRPDIWRRLTCERTGEQQAMTSDYYAFVRQRIHDLSVEDLPPAVVDYVDRARKAMDSGPWNTPTHDETDDEVFAGGP